MAKSDNKNGRVLRAKHSDNSMPSEIIAHEKTFQEQVSSLSDTLVSSNSNVAGLNFKYPPPAIRAFIRHASQTQLTGMLVDVLIALDSKKSSTDKPS